MKENFHKSSSWTADADRRFATSSIGVELGKSLQAGSSSQQALASFVLRDPVFVATHGIEDLASSTGTSPSSVSRFVRGIGLASFSDFRSAVASVVSELIAPVAKLDASIKSGDQTDQGVGASLGAASANATALLTDESLEHIRDCCARLVAARRVYVVGFGISAHLAAMLVLFLQPYRDEVINVAQYGGTESAAARMVSVGAEDVLVAISFPRYSRDIVDLVRYARDKRASVISISDSPASPLAKLSDQLLLAPSKHPVLSSSNVAAISIIEALAASFMLADADNVARAEQLAKALSSYLAD